MSIVQSAQRSWSSYVVAVEAEAFETLKKAEQRFRIRSEDSLHARLEGGGPAGGTREVAGVFDVDYSGHSGPEIHYSVDAKNDTDALHVAVEGIIQSQLDRAKSLPKSVLPWRRKQSVAAS